jgi:hypothetical protein
MNTKSVFTFGLLLGLTAVSGARADEAASPLPPPPLALSLTPGTGGGPWKIRVENTGDVPVRIVADPRLLVLEVTPPAGFVDETAPKTKRAAPKKPEEPKPVRCSLPDDARPSIDEGRELVIPSKRSWSATVDPLLYCFGARERAALVSGAEVKARFGWPAPAAKPTTRGRTKPAVLGPPFVAAPVGAAVGRVAPIKEIEAAAPVTLTESVAVTGATSTPPTSGRPLAVTMADALDVAKGNEISSTVTLANEGDKPVVLLFRPETLRFNVAGPAGSVACGSVRSVGSPIRELFSTLGVKGKSSLSVLLTAICPADTFDEAGIYRVTPVVDTSAASGRPIGLKTWDDVATGQKPMLLRVRSQRRPPVSPSRPTLD